MFKLSFIPSKVSWFVSPVILLTSQIAFAGPVFFSEIHYDNIGKDVNEGVEIAAPSGTSLNGWRVDFYNGSNSSVYKSIELSGVIASQQSGFGTLSFFAPGLQNGGSQADGMALIDDNDTLIQFLSYEGVIEATIGTSEAIGVEELNSTPLNYSMQLVGEGSLYEDFSWQLLSSQSFGEVNAGQRFAFSEPIPGIDTLADVTASDRVGVPAPGALLLLSMGLLGLGLSRKDSFLPQSLPERN